jgi:vacuolar protein sorting-associated protein VTA1
MAKIIPACLRSTDIGLFAMRAAQIEKTKPVIAYWCESQSPGSCSGCWSLLNRYIAGNFHIVNQIIGRGLHTSNDEIKIYTTNLVDKLEQVRRIPQLDPLPAFYMTDNDAVE